MGGWWETFQTTDSNKQQEENMLIACQGGEKVKGEGNNKLNGLKW